jgi:hypothetical protein
MDGRRAGFLVVGPGYGYHAVVGAQQADVEVPGITDPEGLPGLLEPASAVKDGFPTVQEVIDK